MTNMNWMKRMKRMKRPRMIRVVVDDREPPPGYCIARCRCTDGSFCCDVNDPHCPNCGATAATPARLHWTWCLEFKLQDMWLGAYWRRVSNHRNDQLDVWVCLVPCVPIHVTVTW